MLDKTLGVVGLLTLIAFVGTLIWFVRSTDLAIVLVVVVIMATYDFWRSLFRKRDRNGSQ